MKRLGIILGCVLLLGVAVAAFAQVGHITPVGHVDSVSFDWRTLSSSDVELEPAGANIQPLSQEQAPQNTDQLGTLQLPEDKTYTLSLLGGIEAAVGLDTASAQAGAVEAQGAPLVISGDLKVQGQNMLLLYNNRTGKWDGYNDSSFSVEQQSSYDMLDDEPAAMKIRVISAKATEVTSGGGGGGGCSAAFLAPAALFLLAPLLMLRKRG